VDQDHIGWKSWKLIARTLRPITFALRSPKAIHLLGYSHGEHGELLRRLEVGWEKVACWSTKAAISLKRAKIEEKLLWAYRKLGTHKRSFERYHPQPPTAFPSPGLGVRNPTQKLQSLLSQEGPAKARDFKFGRYIHRVHPNTSP